MYKQVEFTREELYRMAWDRPVLVIAKEIGISDVAMSKACRRAGIPLPGRGYWAAAKRVRKLKAPALPVPKQGQPSVVQFSVLENPPAPRPKVIGAPVDPIEVPTQLLRPHRLVTELQVAAKSAREDKGVLALNYGKVLRVRVSAQHLQRALILMDALIKQVDARGYKARIGGEHTETELVLKEGTVSFRLDERTTQTTPPPPPPRVGSKRHQPEYEPWRPAYVLVGTGEFTLDFGKYQLDGCRRVWKDRRNCPIEVQLHEVMEALPSWEAALNVRRLAREDREAKQRETEKRRVAEARAAEIIRRQRAALVSNLHAWERAERLRHYISAVAAAGGGRPETSAWVEWATVQAQALDPLISNFEEVTNLHVRLEEYFTGNSSWDKPVKDWWS